MKKIVRIIQANTGLRAFLTFILFMTCAIVFGQDSTVTAPEDPTNDWADWASRILAILGIIFPAWDAYKAKARDRASRAQDVLAEFVRMVNNNDTTPSAFRSLATKAKLVVKKDSGVAEEDEK